MLNSRTGTDRTETKTQKQSCSKARFGYFKMPALSKRLILKKGVTALSKWLNHNTLHRQDPTDFWQKGKLASRFVQHEEHCCFLPNTLRKDMKILNAQIKRWPRASCFWTHTLFGLSRLLPADNWANTHNMIELQQQSLSLIAGNVLVI